MTTETRQATEDTRLELTPEELEAEQALELPDREEFCGGGCGGCNSGISVSLSVHVCASVSLGL